MDFYGRATTAGARQGRVICHNWVLIVLESASGGLFVDNTLTRELLVVVSNLDGKQTWIVYFAICENKLAVFVDFRSKLICAKSYFDATNTRLLKPCHIYGYLSVSVKRSLVRRHILDDDLLIVVEFLGSSSDHVTTINGDLQVIEGQIVSMEQRVALSVQECGGVAVHQLISHNSRVSEHSMIEDTHGFVATKVRKSRSIDSNLRVSGLRSTCRLNTVDLGDVVVPILHWGRPHVFLKSKSKVDISGVFNSWRDAFNLSG